MSGDSRSQPGDCSIVLMRPLVNYAELSQSKLLSLKFAFMTCLKSIIMCLRIQHTHCILVVQYCLEFTKYSFHRIKKQQFPHLLNVSCSLLTFICLYYKTCVFEPVRTVY